MDRPNLTVLSRALMTRLTFSGRRATGVEFTHDGKLHRIAAGREMILSLGAMHTPKVLMQSGVGDENELRRFGIPVVQHLPGVGRGLAGPSAVCQRLGAPGPAPSNVHSRGDCVFEEHGRHRRP